MSIYITMSSNKCLEYFPQNKSYTFKSHLSTPLLLEGTWKIALVEADIACTISKSDAIYLYSDICGESILDGEQRPLLRILPATSMGNWLTVVETPFYVPIKNKNIYDIDIYITTERNNLASFLDQPSTITLHLKSFPFF